VSGAWLGAGGILEEWATRIEKGDVLGAPEQPNAQSFNTKNRTMLGDAFGRARAKLIRQRWKDMMKYFTT
jgi:hypothetical protein